MSSPLPAPTWRPEPHHPKVSSLGIGLVTGTIAFFLFAIAALFCLRRADQRRKRAQVAVTLRRVEEGQAQNEGDQGTEQFNQGNGGMTTCRRFWWKIKSSTKSKFGLVISFEP